jgi:hypothetical protein
MDQTEHSVSYSQLRLDQSAQCFLVFLHRIEEQTAEAIGAQLPSMREFLQVQAWKADYAS